MRPIEPVVPSGPKPVELTKSPMFIYKLQVFRKHAIPIGTILPLDPGRRQRPVVSVACPLNYNTQCAGAKMWMVPVDLWMVQKFNKITDFH